MYWLIAHSTLNVELIALRITSYACKCKKFWSLLRTNWL